MNVGFDIGSYALKGVVGKKSGSQFQILQAIEAPNPVGSVFPSQPQEKEQLIASIRNFFESHEIPRSRIRVALPEAFVSTKLITIPLLSDAELASAIQWQVEQHIPIPLDEMQYEYTVLRRSGSQEQEPSMDVLIIGVKEQIVEGFSDLLLEANIDVEDIETDTLSQLRVLEQVISPEENVAVLQVGASTSTLALISQGNLAFVHSASIGGIFFTRAIERGIGLDPMRSEEYKRTYGLLSNQLEGRVRAAISPVVDSLVVEIQKAFRFFGSQKPGEQIQRLYVGGGSLYLPDLLPYLSQSLSLEIVPIELGLLPFLAWKEATSQDSRFLVALGLAMKE